MGWLSSVKLMAGLKVCKESRYQNLGGCSCTLPIIELKALLNISFVLWEIGFLRAQHKLSRNGIFSITAYVYLLYAYHSSGPIFANAVTFKPRKL